MARKFRGADKHLKRLKAMTPAMVKEAEKLVYVLADMHATEAALLITAGAVSGKNHVPSMPYQAPNADTHHLDRSIHVQKVGPLRANSVADAEYAVKLEFGTSKMESRPFMRPAANYVRRDAAKLAKAAVKRINKGGKL